MPDDNAVIDTGVADAGAGVVADVALDTTQGVDNADAGDQSAEGTQDQQNADAQADAEGAEGSLPYAKLKAHVEELKKTNPALAKELKTAVFAMEALKQLVPGGVPEVKKALETIEALGGTEGIGKINAQREEWATIDQKFADGDPTVLDTFAQFNPEGFAKIIPAALDKLASINRDAYNHHLAGIFTSTLDSWKFSDSLESMAERLGNIVDKDGKQLCAKEIQQLAKMAEQYDGLKTLAANAPKKVVDEGQKQIAEERAKVAQERAQISAEYVGNATQTHAVKEYETLIPAEARNQKLNIETLKKAGSYPRFIRQIDNEIAIEISKDKSTVQKIQASIAAGRRDEAVKLSNSKFDAVKGKVVQNVVREWATLMNPAGVTGKKPNAAGNGNGPVPAGVKQLPEAPDISLVDKADPEWRTNYMMHSKAKLSTGQRVQW